MEVLSDTDRRLVAGYIINRFRGDISLFDSGIDTLTKRTRLACFGVVPYFEAARHLPAEDSVAIGRGVTATADARVKIVVPVFSRISNFDDLDPLIAEADVDVRFVEAGEALPGDADLVVLPGSKATIADLMFVRQQGWDIDIAAHLRRGGWLLGLCGGFQMLGNSVRDPSGIEGTPGEEPGLHLMDMDTVLDNRKQLVACTGTHCQSGEPVTGYEMHIGRTSGPATNSPMLVLDGRPDGAISKDGKTMGCYVHGLFSADAFRHAFLNSIRQRHASGLAYELQIENTLDELAVHLEANLDLDAIGKVAEQRTSLTQPSTAPTSSVRAARRQ
jgi:adenosylcobyric acid synthase